MNKTISFTLAILMLSSIFAGAFVMADSDDSFSADSIESSITVDSIESTDVTSSELSSFLDETAPINNEKRIGFAKVWKGHGSIDNGKQGRLISGAWAQQDFVVSIDGSNDNSTTDTRVKSLGRIKINGDGVYKLIKVEESSITNLVSFYLVSKNLRRERVLDSQNNVNSDLIEGKLTLTVSEKFKGLTRWNGELSLDNGNLAGSWNVELSTTTNRIRANGHDDTRRLGRPDIREAKRKFNSLDDDKKSELKERARDKKSELKEKFKALPDDEKKALKNKIKRGFWQRFRSWFGGN